MDSTFPAFDPAAPQAQAIHSLFVQVLVVSAVIFAIVAGLITVAIYRGRRRTALPEQDFGNEKSEIIWMIGPVLIVFWLVVISAMLVMTINAVPKADPPGDPNADLVVTGHQWWWEVQYARSGVIAANEIHVPAGKKLRLRLKSADVIHSFWVPQLGRKMDVIPGRDNYLWLEADNPGVYQGRCAEYCGVQHAWMEFKVYAHTPADFEKWLAGHRAAAVPPAKTSTTDAGRDLFMKLTCPKCHAIAGTTATATIAPNLTHLSSRKELAGGAIANSRENLRLWLKDPQAIKPGCKMPNFKLSEQHLDDLVGYLEALK